VACRWFRKSQRGDGCCAGRIAISVPRPIASWFRFGARTGNHELSWTADDAMHPPLIFSIAERGSSNRRAVRNDAEASSFVTICNAKATLRMRLCTPPRSHLHRREIIPYFPPIGEKSFYRVGNDAVLSKGKVT